jgi:DNA-binding CsgD family transcriptional regulator
MTTNTSSRDERTFAEVKRLSLAGLDGPELLRRTAERLKDSLPFETYTVATLDPASNLITHLSRGQSVEEDLRALEVFLDRVYLEEDLDRLFFALRQRRPIQLLSESTDGEFERSLRYRELLKPRGFGYEMDGAFIDGSAWGVMAMMREAGDPDFRSGEVALMKRVAPHVGAGLKAAVLCSEASMKPAAEDAPGVLTLDRYLCVLSYTPTAERLLSELEELDPFWLESRGLPVPVRMAANAVRRALAPGSDRDLNLIPKVRARARSGRWLTLHGSLIESSDGRLSETVVVIEPAKPDEVAWLEAAAYGLSLREEEVVKLVVRGFSTKQISQALFISENTVQRHLSNVFEKVGVRSRRELVKRLFFENLLPGMIGD